MAAPLTLIWQVEPPRLLAEASPEWSGGFTRGDVRKVRSTRVRHVAAALLTPRARAPRGGGGLRTLRAPGGVCARVRARRPPSAMYAHAARRL
eukprot:6105708-Prymnesium_polylepis.2